MPRKKDHESPTPNIGDDFARRMEKKLAAGEPPTDMVSSAVDAFLKVMRDRHIDFTPNDYLDKAASEVLDSFELPKNREEVRRFIQTAKEKDEQEEAHGRSPRSGRGLRRSSRGWRRGKPR